VKKTIMVHIDGVPTHSFEELGPRTVWQAATIPHLDHLARQGELGRLGIPKESRPFAGELAFFSLLGYDTQKEYAGPGAFEGMNLEVVLDRNDVAFICDFVTLRTGDDWGDGKKLGSALVMDDVSGGGLETEEARELIDAINEQLVSENIQFYLGHQARHLMVWVGGNAKIGCRNPQEALGQSIDPFLATGEGSQILRELMEASRVILRHHPVNQERVSAGLKPANCLWPWGQSKPVELTPLKERWPIQGAVVSPSGPYRGVAMASGLHVVKVEDQDENEPDRLRNMAGLATKILEKQDLACLHVPFSSGLPDQGPAALASTCVERLEQIDEYLIGPLRQSCGETDDVRLFVVATPSANKSEEEAHLPTWYVLYQGPRAGGESSTLTFKDQEVSAHPLHNAANFFERLFGKT
jgi:2,3-bisphosphoglycerate-independent phosphoglycerate mutase